MVGVDGWAQYKGQAGVMVSFSGLGAPCRGHVRQAGVNRSRFEEAIDQAARGGSFAGSASISGGVSSAIPSICI